MLKVVKVLLVSVVKLDPARHVANHLVGKNHTGWHRRGVGLGIITIGVYIMKIPAPGYLHFVIDGMGGLVHALGSMAFLSPLEKLAEGAEKKE